MGPAIVGNFCYKHRGGKLNPKVVLRPTNGTYVYDIKTYIYIYILTFLTQSSYKQPERSKLQPPIDKQLTMESTSSENYHLQVCGMQQISESEGVVQDTPGRGRVIQAK